MIDHGALGTLMIGLASVRAERDIERSPVRSVPTPVRGPRSLRVSLAGALRQAADLLEPAPRQVATSR
jgi:hypothetical protein